MSQTNAPSLLQFPCDFPIKAVGLTREGLESTILSVVNRHAAGQLSEGCLTSRTSKQGKYTSVTVNLRAESQTQLDAIYRELSSSPDILMVL